MCCSFSSQKLGQWHHIFLWGIKEKLRWASSFSSLLSAHSCATAQEMRRSMTQPSYLGTAKTKQTNQQKPLRQGPQRPAHRSWWLCVLRNAGTVYLAFIPTCWSSGQGLDTTPRPYPAIDTCHLEFQQRSRVCHTIPRSLISAQLFPGPTLRCYLGRESA